MIPPLKPPFIQAWRGITKLTNGQSPFFERLMLAWFSSCREGESMYGYVCAFDKNAPLETWDQFAPFEEECTRSSRTKENPQ
jgi:hypothetical protein